MYTDIYFQKQFEIELIILIFISFSFLLEKKDFEICCPNEYIFEQGDHDDAREITAG